MDTAAHHGTRCSMRGAVGFSSCTRCRFFVGGLKVGFSTASGRTKRPVVSAFVFFCLTSPLYGTVRLLSAWRRTAYSVRVSAFVGWCSSILYHLLLLPRLGNQVLYAFLHPSFSCCVWFDIPLGWHNRRKAEASPYCLGAILYMTLPRTTGSILDIISSPCLLVSTN